MKHNDEFKIYTNEYDDDARAVKESELLPIYEAMNFSGDLQPLEDVQYSEYEKIEKNDRRTDGQKQEIKKKIRPTLSGLYKNKKLVRIALCALACVCVITGLTFGIIRLSQNEHPISMIYETEEEKEILLSNGKKYSVSDAELITVSDNGMMLFYGRNSAKKTGKYDLRLVNASKKSSLKKGGATVDNGVDEGWVTNADGSLLCYSKTEDGVKTLYVYNTEKSRKTEISENVQDFYLPKTGDVVYYTCKVGTTTSLHRVSYGEDPKMVADEITHIEFFNTEQEHELLYTVNGAQSLTVDVYSIKNLEAPKKICGQVSEVYMDDYAVTGNLYYFINDPSAIDWKDFIDDPYFDTDATLTRPVEGDYMVNKGFIFDIYVLDKVAYNSALNQYNAKLLRDSIREELDKINLGLAVGKSHICYVYSNGKTKQLATGVALENVLAYTPEDAPRIVYSKTVVGVNDRISMNKLVDLANTYNVARAVDYVTDTLGNTTGISNECIYSWYDSTRVIELTVDEYDVAKTEFILGDKNSMFALTEGNLYCNRITVNEIMAGQLIDSDVSDCEFVNGFLYYTKLDSNGSKSLYRYSAGEGKQHLADDLFAYFVSGEDNVFLLSLEENDTELISVAVYSGGVSTVVDTGIGAQSFVFDGASVAYIKDFGGYDAYDAGDAYYYSVEDGSNKVKENVTKILYIKEN